MYYSPSEIAEKLGVAYSTINKKIRVLKKQLSPYTSSRMGRIVISDEGVEIIKESIQYKYSIKKEERKPMEYKEKNGYKYEETISKIPLIKLNDEDYKRIQKAVKSKNSNNWRISRYPGKTQMDLYVDLYKLRFIIRAPIEIIARYFDVHRETISRILKKSGWNFTKNESAQIASKLRDYKQIRLKAKQTLSNNNTLLMGSAPEEYVRQRLNLEIPMHIPNAEIIIGINNTSILNNGNEVDIPVVIFYGDKVLKFAVEVDGDFWHVNRENEDNRKESEL
jgi:transposase